MNPPIELLLAATAGASALLAILLVVVKLVHRRVLRWRGVRSAHYIAAVGEMVSRRAIPSNPSPGWASDPLFHDALADFRLLLTGSDRDFVDQLATDLGVHRILVLRSRRRFPTGTRLRAVATLVDLATPLQRHHLRSLLTDSNPQLRTHVVRGLARLHDSESIPAILDQATTAPAWDAARIADALVDMGTDGVVPIRDWIDARLREDEPPVEMVSLAARVLGLVGDPAAEAILVEMLRSEEPDLRIAAASALEHTGGAEARHPLLAALDDREWRVRARAALALGAMADPGLGRPIAALLYDPVWWVRQNAASALGSLPGGDDHLLVALDGPDPYAADAALNQLTVSGVLAAALDRVRAGAGTARDHELVGVANSV